MQQTVNFADRSDAAWLPSPDLVVRDLDPHTGILFESDPLSRPVELAGAFSGRLDFLLNKVDVDLSLALYEHRSNGEYVRLYAPSYEFRASYARDRTERHLLKSGERQQLSFRSERLTSYRLAAGSRLVLALTVIKRPDQEINYGAGADVSEESLEDGRIPLRIRWYASSYLDLPLRR